MIGHPPSVDSLHQDYTLSCKIFEIVVDHCRGKVDFLGKVGLTDMGVLLNLNEYLKFPKLRRGLKELEAVFAFKEGPSIVPRFPIEHL